MAMKAGTDKVHREDAGTAILHDREGPKDKKNHQELSRSYHPWVERETKVPAS